MDARSAVEAAGIRAPRDWRIGPHYLPCPECRRGPRDDRLTLWVRDDGHANWACNRCGWKGNTWTCEKCGKPQQYCRCEELYWNRQRDPAGPGRGATRKPNGSPSARVEPTPPTGEVKGKNPYSDAHEDFWQRCREVEPDDPVGRYLRGRCCNLPDPGSDLRWRPDYRYHYGDWRGPCMVGRVTHALTGEPISFHFTWVKPDGSGKAPLKKARLIAEGMSPQGGVVRLTDPGEEGIGDMLVVGEGIETVLSSRTRFPRLTRFWSTLTANGMEKLLLPDWAMKIGLLIDHDFEKGPAKKRAGQEAAEELQRRHADRPLAWEPYIPAVEGWDMNDVAIAEAQEHCGPPARAAYG